MIKKRFNEIYAKYGGIYTDDITEEDHIIHKEIKWISSMLNTYYNNKKVCIITPEGLKNTEWDNLNMDKDNYHPHINVYSVNSLIPNAFATKIDEEYCIGILKGLNIFLKERIKYFVEDEAFSNIPEVGRVIPWRMNQVLYENCIKFLVFHEFFHINNGHCDLGRKLGIYELCEVSSNVNIEHSMIIQTLEYDADCCAIAALINEEIRMYQMTFINMGMGDFGCIIDSLIRFLAGVLIGLYILYNWLDGASNKKDILNKKKLEHLTHPVPGLRICYIALNAFNTLSNTGFFTKEQINQISERVLKSLFIFIKSFEDVADPQFISIMKTELGINHMQKVHDNWKQVREMLDVHYTHLAPYDKCDFKSLFKGDE